MLLIFLDDKMAAGHDVQHPVDCLAGNPGAAAGLAHFRPALALVLRPKPVQHKGIGPDTAALLARVPAAIAPPAISAVLSVLAAMAAAIAAIAPVLPAAEGGRPTQGQNVIIEI